MIIFIHSSRSSLFLQRTYEYKLIATAEKAKRHLIVLTFKELTTGQWLEKGKIWIVKHHLIASPIDVN